jgi:hypothetical protein
VGTDRAQLEAWIAASRTTQRRLKIFLVVACIGAVVVSVFSHALGALVFVSIAIVAVFGFWITGGHITDWEHRIHAVEQPPKKTASGRLRRERD